jgi:hypothetical protein
MMRAKTYNRGKLWFIGLSIVFLFASLMPTKHLVSSGTRKILSTARNLRRDGAKSERTVLRTSAPYKQSNEIIKISNLLTKWAPPHSMADWFTAVTAPRAPPQAASIVLGLSPVLNL